MSSALSLGDPAKPLVTDRLADLPQALVLNSLPLRCPGVHQVTRLRRPETKEERRALEERVGTSIYVGEKHAYAAGEVTAPDGHLFDVACDLDRGLHLFDLRAALAAQARERGFTVWFGFGGEVHVAGLPGEERIGPILVQRRLRLRVVDEGWDEPETRLVAKHATRWLAGSLADPEVQRLAIGEAAERTAGHGPRRADVVGFAGDEVILRHHGREDGFPASDYALTAHSGFVRRQHGVQTLRALQVASGSLTQTGQRNQYAVKDRFAAVVADLAAIGFEIAMPGGRQATIEPSWVEVRVQGTP